LEGDADVSFVFSPVESNRLLPIAGDWNGDRQDGVGVYDPDTGTFYLRDPLSEGRASRTFRFGPVDDALLPVAGDWNGDGTDNVGVYDPRTGEFLLRFENSAGAPDRAFNFGPANQGWLPIAGNWNKDPRDSAGVVNPETGAVRLRDLHQDGPADVSFKINGSRGHFQPIAGKWDPGINVILQDSTDGPENFLWKPNSEGGSGSYANKVAILMPSDLNGRVDAVEVHRDIPPDASTLLERTRYSGQLHGGSRSVWRTTQTGCSFGRNIFVIGYIDDGRLFGWPIPNGCNRTD
jgi:hypothetical protein